MEALLKIYQRQRRGLKSDSAREDTTKLKQTLQSLWQVVLMSSDYNITLHKTLPALPINFP